MKALGHVVGGLKDNLGGGGAGGGGGGERGEFGSG